MKTLFLVILLFLLQLNLPASAQKWVWRQSGMEISTGVNQLPLQLNAGPVFKRWDALSFNLMQRFYAGDGGGSMRAAIDFYILPQTDYKYYVTGFGMGWAYFGNIKAPVFRYFAGLDLRVQTEREEYLGFAETDLQIGILPNIGLQYRFLPRFSLTSEVAFFLAMRQRRTDALDVSYSYLEKNKVDFVAKQHRMFGLGLGFWF